jgi:hypothetical protein
VTVDRSPKPSTPAGGSQPPYNPVFTHFVDLDSDGDDQLEGLVAYGFYKLAKREWARDIAEREHRKPSEAELAAYVATWTASRLNGLRAQARAVLASFAESVVDDARPRILREALRGSAPKTVGLNILSAFLYTLLLLALLIILRFAGVDVLSLAGAVGGAPPRP